MATYYVDPVSGVDSNAGTSEGAPIKEFRYAQQLASAGDIVELLNSSQNPCRMMRFDPISLVNDSLDMDAAITITGPSKVNRAAVTTAVNISHGVTRGNLLLNPTLDQWTGGAGTQTEWSSVAGGTLTEETSTTYDGGDTAIKLVGAGAFTGIEQDIWLPKNMTLRMGFAANIETASRYCAGRFWDRTANTYWDWQSTGWGADSGDRWMRIGTGGVGSIGSYHFAESNSSDFPNDITTQNNGRHTVKVSSGSNTQTWYADAFHLTPIGDHINYTWQSDTTTDVYYLDVLHFQPIRVLVCTVSAWSVLGAAAFSTHQASLWRHHSLANCRATESTHFFDSTNSRLYIHLPSGTDITTLRIEAYPKGAVMRTAEDVILRHLVLTGAGGALNPSGATVPNNSLLQNVDAESCASSFGTNAGKMRLEGCRSVWCRVGYTDDTNTSQDVTIYDYLASGASTEIEAEGCTAEYGTDDGFQAAAGGTMDCTGCLALNGLTQAQSQNTGGAHGFKIIASGDCTGTFQNCSAVGMGNGSGFLCPDDAGTSAVFTADQCVAEGNSGFGFNLGDGASGPTTLTVTNSITDDYTETGTTAFSTGTGNESVQDADITETGVGTNGELDSDSAAVGAGSKWWTDTGRPLSANKEPYPDVNVDKGGLQSKHSATHPSNS